MEVYNGGGSGDNSGGSGDNSRSDSDQNYQNSPGSSSWYSNQCSEHSQGLTELPTGTRHNPPIRSQVFATSLDIFSCIQQLK